VDEMFNNQTEFVHAIRELVAEPPPLQPTDSPIFPDRGDFSVIETNLTVSPKAPRPRPTGPTPAPLRQRVYQWEKWEKDYDSQD